MIRVVASTSGAAARSYFKEGLARADYYTDEIIGLWHGKGAPLLGLSGEVTQEAFSRLVDNQHPETGVQLTPRQNEKRTVGWDFNFHAPKSFSLAHSIGGDTRLLTAFRESVAETMADIETQTQTRVRIHGAQRDRNTENLCWAEFVHLTARPIGGIPDPHTHVHAYVFNSTFDSKESRWKAAKIKEARRDIPLHQARFHSRLALRTKALGYEIKRTRQGWEIMGIDRSSIDKFSRRTNEIERITEERKLTSDVEKDKLGALTREGKRRGLSRTELQQAWQVRLSPEELSSIQNAGKTSHPSPPKISPQQAIDHAVEKLYARDAVVRRSRILAEALRYGVGQVSPEAALQEYQSRDFWEKEYFGEILVTHREVLSEEIALVTYVREGKGKFSPLVPGKHHLQREFLSEEQEHAVSHILQSKDRVIAMRGAAGTGKTTTMQEVVEAIEAEGWEVYPLAPSADASRDTLRKAGFAKADTVAQFLINPELHEAARGQVIWVDEAGLLGTRDLAGLTEKAGPDTRIILTGDTRQHAPVSRGDAFRTLQRFGGLRPVEITEIRRQEPTHYKEAVSHLSQGNLKEAFLRLDSMGAIREISDYENRYRQLAKDYSDLSHGKTSPLVVSPTRKEGRTVTEAIRNRLKEEKLLHSEKEFQRFRPLHLETAEKKEAENYSAGMMIQFHQNAKGVQRGERFTISNVSEDGKVLLESKRGATIPLDPNWAPKFQVFARERTELAAGEQILITRNGFSLDGKRHSNGNLRQVRGFTQDGNIQLTTGAILDRKDGHWDYGYCQTSHSSQSKSVRDVLIAQSSDSLAAASREQFYVSVSRGKERVFIYTDDKQMLEESVGISSANRSALELAKDSGRHWNEMIEKELNGAQWKKAVHQEGPKLAANRFVSRLEKERKSRNQERIHPLSHRAKDKVAQQVVQNRNSSDVLQKRLRNITSTRPRSPSRRMHRLLRTMERSRHWQNATGILRQVQRKASQIRSFRKTASPRNQKDVKRRVSSVSARKVIIHKGK